MANMRMAIYFGDNDFWQPFLEIGKVLYNSYKHFGHMPEDKEDLVNIINGMLSGMCALYCARHYPGKINFDPCTAEYLKIDASNIFLYDEVEEFIARLDPGNEAIVIDSRLDFPGNEPVFLV